MILCIANKSGLSPLDRQTRRGSTREHREPTIEVPIASQLGERFEDQKLFATLPARKIENSLSNLHQLANFAIEEFLKRFLLDVSYLLQAGLLRCARTPGHDSRVETNLHCKAWCLATAVPLQPILRGSHCFSSI